MYVKLFSKILDSSIWLENHPTRIVWLTLLVSMDADGFAQFASLANLARRAVVTIEEAETAVKTLESPDSNSSDPENEGRRIERVPGGWMILSSRKYREISNRIQALEATRIRVAKHRERKRLLKNDEVTVTKCNDVTVTSASASASASAVEGAGRRVQPKKNRSESIRVLTVHAWRMPEAFSSSICEETWRKWITYRVPKGGSLDFVFMFQEQLDWLGTHTEAAALEILNTSMRNGWTGLFEPKNAGNPPPKRERPRGIPNI